MAPVNLYAEEFSALAAAKKDLSSACSLGSTVGGVANRKMNLAGMVADMKVCERRKHMQRVGSTESSSSTFSSRSKTEELIGWGQFVDTEGIPQDDQSRYMVSGFAFETVNHHSGSWGRFFEDDDNIDDDDDNYYGTAGSNMF